jgi:hypothetical protein
MARIEQPRREYEIITPKERTARDPRGEIRVESVGGMIFFPKNAMPVSEFESNAQQLEEGK